MSTDNNTLIVYPPENGLYPFDWVQPDDDAPYVYPGPGEEPPPYSDDWQQAEEEFQRYLADRDSGFEFASSQYVDDHGMPF